MILPRMRQLAFDFSALSWLALACGLAAASASAQPASIAPSAQTQPPQPVAATVAAPPTAATLMVVAGAVGETEFTSDFAEQMETWRTVSKQAGATFVAIGIEPIGEGTDHAAFKRALEQEARTGGHELWLVLIGHGTFDNKEAKFNLRGPDVTATELAAWLKPIQRPMALIDTASASAPFMAKLAGPRRVVVTSTRSGNEHNYARFGKYFAEAMADVKSDLDKDGQVSLLEGFLSGSHRTNEFYKTEGRLATEHALIDDNGDGLGTPSDWFRGVRATKKGRDGVAPDGTRAQQFTLVRSQAEQQLSPEQRGRRDKLELEIAELREAKAKMNEEKYYQALEKLMLELAAVYDGT